MKNFEMNCPVEGTSALQPKLDSAVRTGSAQGVAFGRVQRWQAVVGGCVFAALALASLFAGF